MSIPEMYAQVVEVERLFPFARRVLSPYLTGLPPRLEVPHLYFVIEPRFAPDHPYSPFHISLQPGVLSRHYYVHAGETLPRLCWCTPADWSPRWHLVVGVMAAMRFLNDFVAHRMD